MKTILRSPHFNMRPILGYAFILAILSGCEDYVDIDPPNNQLTGLQVFEDPSTVNAALANIYGQLRDQAITSGGTTGLTYLMGHYADELTLYNNSQPDIQNFYENNLLATNFLVLNIWNGSYNQIYGANAIIEGVQNSQTLTMEERNQFLGEAYFLRAFIHFHMVNLFGDIPYIESTDYVVNSQVSRLEVGTVYEKVINDLEQSKLLLTPEINGINTRPNKWVATALLARVFLYSEEWDSALEEAMEIIHYSPYTMNEDLNQVFLKNSSETLWQFDTGNLGSNTIDALTYIFTMGPPPDTALSGHLIDSFEAGDARFENWIGSVTDGQETWYHAYKYKLNYNTGGTQECTILIRLAELYLIAAEANVHLGNITEALEKLNVVRERANLPVLDFMDNESLLGAIYQERKIEFFSEQAHRWFDLNRTNFVNQELAPIKPNWDITDRLLPIPETELILNQNLEPQNEGY